MILLLHIVKLQINHHPRLFGSTCTSYLWYGDIFYQGIYSSIVKDRSRLSCVPIPYRTL